MQYMFEKEFVFYEEYCKEPQEAACDKLCNGIDATTPHPDNTFTSGYTSGFAPNYYNDTCMEECVQPFICEAALTQYNFIFTLFRNDF